MYSEAMPDSACTRSVLARAGQPQRVCVPTSRNRGDGIAIYVVSLSTGLLGAVLLGGRRYIDPGSGSFAIQIIIAAVLGGLLTARLWLRHMFWRVFGRGRRSKSDDQPSVEEADR